MVLALTKLTRRRSVFSTLLICFVFISVCAPVLGAVKQVNQSDHVTLGVFDLASSEIPVCIDCDTEESEEDGCDEDGLSLDDFHISTQWEIQPQMTSFEVSLADHAPKLLVTFDIIKPPQSFSL